MFGRKKKAFDQWREAFRLEKIRIRTEYDRRVDKLLADVREAAQDDCQSGDTRTSSDQFLALLGGIDGILRELARETVYTQAVMPRNAPGACQRLNDDIGAVTDGITLSIAANTMGQEHPDMTPERVFDDPERTVTYLAKVRDQYNERTKEVASRLASVFSGNPETPPKDWQQQCLKRVGGSDVMLEGLARLVVYSTHFHTSSPHKADIAMQDSLKRLVDFVTESLAALKTPMPAM